MAFTREHRSYRITNPPGTFRGKALLRLFMLLAAAAAVAALASRFGVSHDYAYLRAALLSGAQGGWYHTLATRLAAHARQEHGVLTVVPTAGSIENVRLLAEAGQRCTPAFALVQDGIPVPADAGLEMLGRLPEPESLLLLARRNRTFLTFADLRGASIGIGPEASGTAYLLRQVFDDPDLQGLGVRLSYYELTDQARLVSQGALDLAAVVMQEDAELLRTVVHQYDLDIATFQDLPGLVARHPWLGLGQIPAGFYDLVRPTPSLEKPVARVDTLVVANSCARRAERVALLMLLTAELPGFLQANPPKHAYSAAVLPLASEARQYFIRGEPEIADLYFPWLVDLLSPAYWVYFVMAATILFNVLKGISRFRLWRIDTGRERLERRVKELTDPGSTHAQIRALPSGHRLTDANACATAQSIRDQLSQLRARCQRQVSSIVTPMGDEMFYRYQQSLIDEATTTLALLLQHSPNLPEIATGQAP
ncbi:MAG: hypothetical protein JO358_03010 [Alphaproteobacteria bacterium]|nr:hypothetical protein [Alphaproteobacteria bacterium]